MEVHGNDGTSHLTFAENEVKRQVPNAMVVGSRFTGERCDHGSLLVEVYYLASDET